MNYRKFRLFLWPVLLALLTAVLSSRPADAIKTQLEGPILGPKVVITAEDYDAFTFVRPIVSSLPRGNQPLAATFNITYVGVPAPAQTAFQYAADIWAALLTSSQTINVTLTWSDLPGSILGQAGPTGLYANFTGAPIANTWYPVALGESLFGGNLNPRGNPDISAEFDSTGTSWYFGTDGNPAPGEFDFVSVALHELGHGLGFVGSMKYDNGIAPNKCARTNGQGCWGIPSPLYPLVYDRFTEDNVGTALLNVSVYPNPSLALGTALTSNALFFDGTNANTANGDSPPPISAPASWVSGSSYSHLDEASFPAGDPNSLMTPAIGSAEAIHDPGQITLCLFVDMGWDAFCNPNAIWDGGGATNNWSEGDNWDTDLAPGATTAVTFNATSTKDAIIDSSFGGTIAGMTVAAGYTGTISQTDDITLTGSLVQSDGVYTATIGTLTFDGSGDWATTPASSFGDVQIGTGMPVQVISLTTDVKISGNITIADGTLLDGGSSTIQLSGDWLEEGVGFNPGTSTVILEGSAQTVSKPVTSTVALTFYNLTVDNSTISFTTDVVIQNDMLVNAGAAIDFGSNEPTVEGTFTNNGVLTQTLDVPGSMTTRFLHITDAAGTTDKYYGVDITPTAGLGSAAVTIYGNQSNCSTNPADAFIGRCFNISPTTPASASVRFWYTEAERNGQDANALVVWHHNGAIWNLAGDTPSWSEAGPTCTSGGGLACWAQVENVTDYSPFVPGANTPPTAISFQSVGIRDGLGSWLVWGLTAGLLLLSGGLILAQSKGSAFFFAP